mgnify:CR=1 FL=1
MRVVGYSPDGPPRGAVGEWRFAWVLEGRSAGYVRCSRPLPDRSALPRGGNRHGSSICVYNTASRVWKVIWANPVTGVEDHLVGRCVGDVVVLEGRRPDRSLIRLPLVNITRDFFTWHGERSTHGGALWGLMAHFFGRRVAGMTPIARRVTSWRGSWSGCPVRGRIA